MVKTIYSTLTKNRKHCAILRQKGNILKYQIVKVDSTDRKKLLRKREKGKKIEFLV